MCYRCGMEFPDRSKIGFVTGLAAEARLLRHTGFVVEAGGGDPAGAGRGAARLINKDVTALVSFGLAGGLNPRLRPGDVLVPQSVIEDGEVFACDPGLLEMLGGANSKLIAASHRIAGTAAAKRDLFARSLADAVDLESGAVARAARLANLPFAVLRAVTDPAERTLPPAALIALNSAGKIKMSAVLVSVFKQPLQIPALLAIAQDAAKARAALMGKLRKIG